VFAWVAGVVGEEGPTALGWTLLLAGVPALLTLLCSLALAALSRGSRGAAASTEVAATTEAIRLADIRAFPAAFWLLSVACLAYYGSLFPFISLAQDFFMAQFGFTSQQANNITSMVYLVSAPASPVVGVLVDKAGRNISWVFLSVTLSITCFVLLTYTAANPYLAILLLGVAYR